MLIEKVCAREECFNLFIPAVHNGIYCSPECRKAATNKKVLERYYRNKDKKANMKKRVCKSRTCKTILSMYNKEDICETCKNKRLYDRLALWGWDHDEILKKMDSMEF